MTIITVTDGNGVHKEHMLYGDHYKVGEYFQPGLMITNVVNVGNVANVASKYQGQYNTSFYNPTTVGTVTTTTTGTIANPPDVSYNVGGKITDAISASLKRAQDIAAAKEHAKKQLWRGSIPDQLEIKINPVSDFWDYELKATGSKVEKAPAPLESLGDFDPDISDVSGEQDNDMPTPVEEKLKEQGLYNQIFSRESKIQSLKSTTYPDPFEISSADAYEPQRRPVKKENPYRPKGFSDSPREDGFQDGYEVEENFMRSIKRLKERG